MAKIKLDKYYTSRELAEYVVNKTKEIIGEDNITEYIEPSAGNGVFLDIFDKMNINNYKAYDIEPEDDKNRIITQDYLTLDLDYKKGRCIIGNPPYGDRNNLSLAFYNKSIEIGDYISFILPISQLSNLNSLYKFDLIHSENLGERLYSNIKVHCCLNIYKRPLGNKLNKKPNYKLKDVEIKGRRSGRFTSYLNTTKSNFNYDIAICAWGTVGKEIAYEGQYAQEFYIKISNKKYKGEIIRLLKQVDWHEVYSMTKTPKLQYWQVYKYLKEQIPELE